MKFFNHIVFKFGFLQINCLVLVMSLSQAQAINCSPQWEGFYSQGMSLLQRQQNLLAGQFLATYSLVGCDSDKKFESRLRWAQSLFNLGENEEALEILKPLQKVEWGRSEVKVQNRRRIEVLTGWYQPELRFSLTQETQERFQKWEEWGQALPAEKKPWVAGTLSAILPGAGQVYNGFYQSAAFSFIVNSLFLAAAMEAQNKGLYSLSLAAGTVFSVVYVGNILGSVQSARAINENSQADRIETEKQQKFPELYPSSNEGGESSYKD